MGFSELQQQSAAHVATLLQQSLRAVRWRDDCPGGLGLVVHTPWARVVVARTTQGAVRWAAAWRDGLRSGDLLIRAFQHQYPQELTPWADSRELADQHLPHPRLRGFVTWALQGHGGWLLTPQSMVIGSWASWPDAVLVVRAEGGELVFQLRATEWADFDR